VRLRFATLWGVLAFFTVVLQAAEAAQDDSTAQIELASDVFAVVNGEPILQQTFDTFLQVGKRQRFFHGDVPEAQEVAFRQEVAQRLVDRVLLRNAADERQIAVDSDWVAARLASIEARYESRPHWEAQREGVMAELRPQLAAQSRLERLEAQVRQLDELGEAKEAAIEHFYRVNPKLFTTPPRLRVSLILLAVEPWATTAQWQAAMDEGQRLVNKLQRGGNFAEMARLHSSDGSAASGGDLGYIHQGMLADEAQQVVDAMKPGEVSAVIRLLKGVAIFRVEERVAPVLNSFERVATRARELYIRETSEKNWQAFVKEMRRSADVQMRETLLLQVN